MAASTAQSSQADANGENTICLQISFDSPHSVLPTLTGSRSQAFQADVLPQSELEIPGTKSEAFYMQSPALT